MPLREEALQQPVHLPQLPAVAQRGGEGVLLDPAPGAGGGGAAKDVGDWGEERALGPAEAREGEEGRRGDGWGGVAAERLRMRSGGG